MKINKQNHEQIKIKHKTYIKKKFLLWSFLATLKEYVDKLNLDELANCFYFENEHTFFIFAIFKSRDFPKKFTQNAALGTQTSNKRCRSVETQIY